MTRFDRNILKQLGAGESIAALCQKAGITRDEFNLRWQETIAPRVPPSSGNIRTGVSSKVDIERDQWGIPHIYAKYDADLFFGFGYAMAQDRLFQLDYLRRKASGRLAEILGPSGLELDLIARTVGLRRIAEAEWKQLDDETRALVTSFSDGINALIEASHDNLPIEFDLLDYGPEKWSPVDCIAIECEFRWYLTGRFPVIVMPELAKRTLGDGALYREFLLGEADDECILPAGSYPRARCGVDPLSPALGLERAQTAAATHPTNPTAAPSTKSQRRGQPPGGSNNWVVAGSMTMTGKPLVASDPHIAFEAVSCWYEVHLSGGSFNTVGMAYVGMPAVMFGRTERVAWGMTNNICSQRDLYQEQTSPEHPGCFLFNGEWEPARELTETIFVRGAEPVVKTIRFSRNGPIVDEILPPPGNKTGPVALKWLGAHHGGWLTALLGIDRATNAAEFREALRPWHVPTFSVVYADVEGEFGYQAAGRLPARRIAERGYRPGHDPAHQWEGLIPFDGMPAVANPERGWMATANNRPAPNDFPYLLAGGWISGHRAERIRHVLETARSTKNCTRDSFRDLQQDAVSYHSRDLVPHVCDMLGWPGLDRREAPDDRVRAALKILKAWDFTCNTEAVAPTLFNVFFTKWVELVAAERFDTETAALLVNGVEGAASRLLARDEAGWFSGADPEASSGRAKLPLSRHNERLSDAAARRTTLRALPPRTPDANTNSDVRRRARMLDAFRAALDHLASRFGPDMAEWKWGRLHVMPLKHVLSSRGDLSQLLDHGGVGVRGDKTTVCNTGLSPEWLATTGAGYRLIAELDNNPPGLWAVDGQSQSGHPGSPHYTDQLDDWLAGCYHFLPLDRADNKPTIGRTRQTLEP